MAEPSFTTTRLGDLATASKIIDMALGLARSRKLQPMTIAALDSDGDLVAIIGAHSLGARGRVTRAIVDVSVALAGDGRSVSDFQTRQGRAGSVAASEKWGTK